ncbi:MAG: hypothetical protein ACR2KC_02585 [Acidimicrobiales bacterium]
MQGLTERIVAVHEMLDSLRVAHQFGGAIALAWYRSPRATTDIDLNITVAPPDADPVLGALAHLGVTLSPSDRLLVARDGQARLDWSGAYLDVFFATLELHHEMERRAKLVSFGRIEIPILAAEHLVVCKAIFDRPKDWVDIDAMLAWGADIDAMEAKRWVAEIVGPDSEAYRRLAERMA